MSLKLKYGEFLGSKKNTFSFDEIEITLLRHNKSISIPKHSHEDAHFIFLSNGTYSTEAINIKGQCRPGTLIYNPSGVIHRDQFLSTDGECLIVSMGTNYLENSGIKSYLPLSSFGYQNKRECLFVTKLMHELHTASHLNHLLIENYILSILSEWTTISSCKENNIPKWFTQLVDFLNESEEVYSSVYEIAEKAGVHPVHLNRTFNRFLNCTPGEYLRSRRIIKAAEKLRTSLQPIVEIALESEYPDQSSFTKNFKRFSGYTPQLYRDIFFAQML